VILRFQTLNNTRNKNPPNVEAILSPSPNASNQRNHQQNQPNVQVSPSLSPNASNQKRHPKNHLQNQRNDLVSNWTMIFNFQPPKRPLRNIRNGKGNSHFRPLSHQNQVPFRAHYRKSRLRSRRDLTKQTVNSSHDHHNHNTIQHLDGVNHDSQQHPVHNTRKKSHHENNLLMQQDPAVQQRQPQPAGLAAHHNQKHQVPPQLWRHNMIQPSKYVNDDLDDDPPNLVFVKLQNTRSSSASVTPTWWRPRTDGRSHYVDRLRPDNHHQPPTTRSGGG
jgi:hypothetical protein